jgi:hypothetical protein
MAQMKSGNPLKKLFSGCETCKVIGRIPLVLRGFARARGWKDSMVEGRPGTSILGDPPNPLRTYFDSVATGKGIWKWLHYFDIYHRHFQKFVGKEVRVVEVGIYSGGSLDMWKAYFGPKCMVYGVDIEEACKAYEDERTRVFIGDQGDRRFWRRFREQVPDIDILIDDGGHLPEQQIVTLEETLPYLRGGGVYLCEDMHGTHNKFASYMHGLATALNDFTVKDSSGSTVQDGTEGAVFPGTVQRSICSIHLYPFVTVVERARRPVDQLVAVKHGTEWQPYL